MKDYLLCIISAMLLVFPFLSFNFWISAWFGFLPLFFALRGKTKIQAFILAYITGTMFWLFTIYWLIHVSLFGQILLILYLALYFGIFGVVASRWLLVDSSYSVILISSVWVLLEYLRSHIFTGFPWAILGYSQTQNLAVIQIADITGVWGVSFLVMGINLVLYYAVKCSSSITDFTKRICLPLLCIIVILIYGYSKLHLLKFNSQYSSLKISVVQGNIPQELKWKDITKDFIMYKYFNLTEQALRDRSDLVIWPEAALPVTLEEEPVYYKVLKDFCRTKQINLLFGAVTKRNDLYYNSAILVSQEGQELLRYDKLHLVPFGEYIPLRKIFGFLETIAPIGDFTAGKEYTVFSLPGNLRFSVLICFEDLFPELSRKFIIKGANFLINITNDAWFRRSCASYQHLCASIFRAVENRVFLVRAANTGISGFIAPSGKIISLVKDFQGRQIFVDGYLSQVINIYNFSKSFYTRYGDLFIFLLSILIVSYIIYRLYR